MNCCSRLPLDCMSRKHFTLAIIQRSQLLALQQFDVSVQNCERRFQVVSRGAESIRGALESLLQLGVRLLQLSRIESSFPRCRRQGRAGLCFARLGNRNILLRGGHSHKGRRSNTEGGWTRRMNAEPCTKIVC